MKFEIGSLALGVATPLEWHYDPARLELETQDIEFREKLAFKGTVERGENVLQVKGLLSGSWHERCSRCLALSHRPKQWKIDLAILIQPEQRTADFTDSIREEVLLSMPSKFLCREDCKGLCPRCGENWNVAPCDCAEKSAGKSPFDVLKKLKDRENSGPSS